MRNPPRGNFASFLPSLCIVTCECFAHRPTLSHVLRERLPVQRWWGMPCAGCPGETCHPHPGPEAPGPPIKPGHPVELCRGECRRCCDATLSVPLGLWSLTDATLVISDALCFCAERGAGCRRGPQKKDVRAPSLSHWQRVVASKCERAAKRGKCSFPIQHSALLSVRCHRSPCSRSSSLVFE